MASTYSTNLALELIGTGDQAGVWGNTTNTNLGTLIEQAISGYVTQAVSTGTDTTITIPNGATGVARNMYIELTGTGGTNTNLIVPANKKLYFIFNNSTGAVTVKVSGQTGVSVPQGKKVVLTSNGTDIVNGLNYIADFGSNSATITQLTATSATITNLTLTSLVISNLSIASANITTLTSASATITNLLATSLTVSSGSTLNGGVVINDSGADKDTRIEGDTDANLVFVDASADKVGIGTSSPGSKLEVVTNSGVAQLISNSDATNGFGLKITAGGSASARYALHVLDSTDSTSYFKISTETGQVGNVTIPTGNLGLGVTPSAWNSTVKGFQIGDKGACVFGSTSNNTAALGSNTFVNSVGNDQYVITAAASLYRQVNGVHSWFNAPSGTAGNTISFTQAMTLDASGNLGVGTTSTDSRIHVYGSGEQYIRVGAATGTDYRGFIIAGTDSDASAYGQLKMELSGGQMQLVAGASGFGGFLTIHTNGSERARITSGGDLVVGGTDSYARTTSYSSAAGTPALYAINTTSGVDATLMSFANTTTPTYRGEVSWSHSAGELRFTGKASGTYSDSRLKNVTDTCKYGLNTVIGLSTKTFTWIRNGKEDIGLIAQELYEAVPEAVEVGTEGDVDPTGDFDPRNIWKVDYTKLVPVLIKAMQEQQAMIEELKAKVAALEAK